MQQRELFDVEIVTDTGFGCAKPVGRRRNARPRRRSPRPPRPSTVLMLAELRAMLRQDVGDIRAALARLERGLRVGLEFDEAHGDLLERVLARWFALSASRSGRDGSF